MYYQTCGSCADKRVSEASYPFRVALASVFGGYQGNASSLSKKKNPSLGFRQVGLGYC